jgi:lysophospholipase L1-like esterase
VKDDLAQKDYTHFTYKGAKFVSEMLYKSIIEFEQL